MDAARVETESMCSRYSASYLSAETVDDIRKGVGEVWCSWVGWLWRT
jgi:hypothetical protein